MAMSAFLNRVADLGGVFICSQQIMTQAKSAIMQGNGRPQAQIEYIHTIRVHKANIDKLLQDATGSKDAVYNEFALVPSAYFFRP